MHLHCKDYPFLELLWLLWPNAATATATACLCVYCVTEQSLYHTPQPAIREFRNIFNSLPAMHDFQHPHLRPLLVTSADNIRNYLYDCAHFTRCNIRTSLFYPLPDRITSSALAAVMTKLLKPNVSVVRYFIKPFPFPFDLHFRRMWTLEFV